MLHTPGPMPHALVLPPTKVQSSSATTGSPACAANHSTTLILQEVQTTGPNTSRVFYYFWGGGNDHGMLTNTFIQIHMLHMLRNCVCGYLPFPG